MENKPKLCKDCIESYAGVASLRCKLFAFADLGRLFPHQCDTEGKHWTPRPTLWARIREWWRNHAEGK